MNKAQRAEAARARYPMGAERKAELSELIVSPVVTTKDIAEMTETAIYALVGHKSTVDSAEAKVVKARLKVEAANHALDRAFKRRAAAVGKRERAEKFYVNEARLRVAKEKMRKIK